MSINKDTILQNKNTSEWLDSSMTARYMLPSMLRLYVFYAVRIYQYQISDFYPTVTRRPIRGYDQRTAKLGTINVQTQQKIQLPLTNKLKMTVDAPMPQYQGALGVVLWYYNLANTTYQPLAGRGIRAPNLVLLAICTTRIRLV